jgi:hypothetical protein
MADSATLCSDSLIETMYIRLHRPGRLPLRTMKTDDSLRIVRV